MGRKYGKDWFPRWKVRAEKRLPELEKRITALDKQFYKGCGFHYALHQEVAYLYKLFDREIDVTKTEGAVRSIVLRVKLTKLEEQVANAEKSAQSWNKYSRVRANIFEALSSLEALNDRTWVNLLDWDFTEFGIATAIIQIDAGLTVDCRVDTNDYLELTDMQMKLAFLMTFRDCINKRVILWNNEGI